MTRIPDIKARLERWGCWAAGGRQAQRSAGVSSAYSATGVSRSASDMSLWSGYVPFDETEARETERAVVQLDSAYRDLAHEVYVKNPTGTLTTWGIGAGIRRHAVFSALCRIDHTVAAHLALDRKNPPKAHKRP